MDKISVNVSDSVYGRSCIAGNSLHTTSLHNGVVFLEGAQVTKNGRNQMMIPTFFYARPRHYHLSVATGIATHTNPPKSPIGQAFAHSDDCRYDRLFPANTSTWEHPHSTSVTVMNKEAIFSSFVSNFVYEGLSPFSYTKTL